MEFPMTPTERAAITELCTKDDLKPEQVIRRALRLYQIVSLGEAKVVSPTKLRSYSSANLNDLLDVEVTPWNWR